MADASSPTDDGSRSVVIDGGRDQPAPSTSAPTGEAGRAADSAVADSLVAGPDLIHPGAPDPGAFDVGLPEHNDPATGAADADVVGSVGPDVVDDSVIVSVGSVTVAADDHRADHTIVTVDESGSTATTSSAPVDDAIPVDLRRWATLAAASLTDLGASGELQLSFVDVGEITDLNREYMGVDGPTDVLSFPLDGAQDGSMSDELVANQSTPDQSTPDHTTSSHSTRRQPTPDAAGPPRLLGDVIICPTVAALAAPTHAGTTDDELALLVVHGVLHVLGYDHAEPADTERMRAEERDLLTRYHWNGPPPVGFHHDHLDDRPDGRSDEVTADSALDSITESNDRANEVR